MAQSDPNIRCWRFAEWPMLDQRAWTLGCTPVDPFDDPDDLPRHGAALRPDSLIKISKGYGRWLCFLSSRCALDPSLPPLARVTRTRLQAYFHTLKRAGNADYTIIGRFQELRQAMRILAPGGDVGWINKPDGISVHALLPKRRRPMPVPDSGVVLAAACAMMDQVRMAPATLATTAIAYRDGLLLAMLAGRGRRLRSMSLLRQGHEVLGVGAHYRVELTPDQVKTNCADRFGLPKILSPYIRHYIDVIRPALLMGRRDEAFWISRGGKALTAKSIQHQVAARTKILFGQSFYPHRMRHAIATTAALRAPEQPGLAAGVLGISTAVVEQSYNLSGPSAAALRFAALIAHRRNGGRGAPPPAPSKNSGPKCSV